MPRGPELPQYAFIVRLGFICLLPLPLITACAIHAEDSQPIGFSEAIGRDHLLQKAGTVRGTSISRMETVRLTVTIDETGKVASIKPKPLKAGERSSSDDASLAATTAVQTWRFRPFSYNGKPTKAQVSLSILVYPSEIWAVPAAPFPDVDWDRLKITLTRTACFGRCPAYTVVIDGAGRITFTTPSMPGVHVEAGFHFSRDGAPPLYGQLEDQIDPLMVKRLVDRFRDAHFFDLANRYMAPVTDLSSQTLTVDTGNGVKTVIDYAGDHVGMPQVVEALQKAVDSTASTARWVYGAPGLVDWLASRNVDFRSNGMVDIAMNPALSEPSTLLEMIDRGLPLEQRVSNLADQTQEPLGVQLLRRAIDQGQVALFKRLTDAGWLQRLPAGEANRLFANAGAACNPEFVDVAITAGIAVDAVTGPQPTSTPQAKSRPDTGTWGDTALSMVSHGFRCRHEANRKATAAHLLANGADPNHRNDKGQTALFWNDNPDLVELLLKAGADPTIRDKGGNSAVSYAWQDVVILQLLQAGASPTPHESEGKTLRQWVKDQELPGATRWLAAHDIP